MSGEYPLAGDVVVVTGAARGLGAAYAEHLRDVGAVVVTVDVDQPADVVADVATEQGARSVIDHALARHGRVDAVIANAGTSWHRPFAELTTEEFDRCVRDNLYSTYHIVREAWPHMVAARHGRVVLTSSGGVFGIAGRAHYVAAKGGVLALTATLALEGEPNGIAVNCVLPWGLTRLARPGSAAPDPASAASAVAPLCSRRWTGTGGAYHVGGGRFDAVRGWGGS